MSRPQTPQTDAELRETLELLGTLMASLSDRVDAQGDALDRLTKVSAETRQAAFQAKAQTDTTPARDTSAQAVATFLRPLQTEMTHLRHEVEKGRTTSERIDDLLSGRTRQMQRRIDVLDGVWLNRVPLYAVLALALVVGSAIAVPRAITELHWPTACWAFMGGSTMEGFTPCLRPDRLR